MGGVCTSAEDDDSTNSLCAALHEDGVFSGHSFAVTAVAAAWDGSYVISAAEDSTIRLWSKTGEHLRSVDGDSIAYCLGGHADGGIVSGWQV